MITFIISAKDIAIEVEDNSGNDSIFVTRHVDAEPDDNGISNTITSILKGMTNLILLSELSLAIIALILDNRTCIQAAFGIPIAIDHNSREVLVLNKSFCSSLSK